MRRCYLYENFTDLILLNNSQQTAPRESFVLLACFPALAPVTCLPALGARCMFFLALHQCLVFPLLTPLHVFPPSGAPVVYFPSCFDRFVLLSLALCGYFVFGFTAYILKFAVLFLTTRFLSLLSSYLSVFCEVQRPLVCLLSSDLYIENVYLGVPVSREVVLHNQSLLRAQFHWKEVGAKVSTRGKLKTNTLQLEKRQQHHGKPHSVTFVIMVGVKDFLHGLKTRTTLCS